MVERLLAWIYVVFIGLITYSIGLTWVLPLGIAVMIFLGITDMGEEFARWRNNRKVIRMDKERVKDMVNKQRKAPTMKKAPGQQDPEFYNLEPHGDEGKTILMKEDPETQVWEWDVKN